MKKTNSINPTLTVHLVGEIWGRMKKGEEKIIFCVVWLREKREEKRKISEIQEFSLKAHQNTITLNWGEIWRENRNAKVTSLLGKIIHVQ